MGEAAVEPGGNLVGSPLEKLNPSPLLVLSECEGLGGLPLQEAGELGAKKGERMMEFLFSTTKILIALVAIKAVIVGSDFNLLHWLRDGRRYWEWYDNRPEYRRP